MKTNLSGIRLGEDVGDPVVMVVFRIVGDDEGESIGEIVLFSTTPPSVLT
jgi:hypothetical protein